jgi:hypothetical protein
MNGISRQPARHWSSAEFLSAKDFVRHGVLILLVFAVIHLFGLREYTSVLNGTTGAVDMNPDDAALLGIIYVLFYLAAILLAPIFFIAGGLLAIWEKFRTKRQTST